jgi:hypothetical protein
VSSRRFDLVRAVDETGISGTGKVAEGCAFSDGTVVIRWRGDYSSTVVWATLADAIAVHGHGGLTQVVFID